MTKRLKEHGIGNFAMLSPRGVKNKKTLLAGGTLLHGAAEADWQGPLPKGWTDSSRAKFYKSMSQADHEEGPTKACMDKIGSHVDDPGAFCASLRDQVTGTTKWRHGGKKK